MQNGGGNGFWEGGEDAWWQGLRDALRSASERLKQAETDEERSQAQSELDQLKRQKAEAQRNGDRWLF